MFRTRKKFGIAGTDIQKAKRLAPKIKKGKVEWEDISKNQKARNLHETYRKNLAGARPTIETVTLPERTIVEYAPTRQ